MPEQAGSGVVVAPEKTESAFSSVGTRRRRAEADSRVRGQARYVGDEHLDPSTLHVAAHRSTRPHALIKSIDAADALAVDGVLAVFTGEDLHEVFGERMFTGPAFHDQPPLAYQRVRFVGEPVVAVVAHDVVTARAAAELVVVEYEDLPPVYDIDAALEGTVFVHDELKPAANFGDLKHLQGLRDTNVCYEYVLHTGDASVAGPSRVGMRCWSPPSQHVSIELPCTVAWVDGDRLELLTTTQTPSYVRQAMADLLGVPLSRVRVMTRPLGGGFGQKMYDRLEPLTAALAWILKRKVRFLATREEAFLLVTRHGVRVDSVMSADAEGNLVSATADACYDTGAYADVGPRMTGKSGCVATGPYRFPNVDIKSRCVYTNKPSAGAYRGFGVPQMTWSHESTFDELARACGEDPYEFRLRHLLREGDTAPVGTVMHSADFVGCLNAVTEAIGWNEPLDRGTGRWLRGRGCAVGMKAVLTPTISNATLQVNSDGSATLLISTVEMGQGSNTIMPQIAAEVLGIDSARIRVVAADTDVTGYDTITAGSRSTYHTGNAVRMAAEDMREKLLDIAAGQLGKNRSEIELTPSGVRHEAGGKTVFLPLADLILAHFIARGTTLTTAANFTTEWIPYDHDTGRSTKATEHWFAAAVAVNIAVDTLTGRIRVDHLAVAGDVGRAVNPLMCEQQLIGGALMGLGHALFDELVLDQGQLVNGTLLDYQLPTVRDVPARITPCVVENPHRTGPFGAKGVGETGILAVCPAIGNAVRDAVGVRIPTLPLTPERVFTAMKEAGRA